MYYELLLQGQLVWNTPLLAGIVCLAILYAFLLHLVMNIKMYRKQASLFFLGLGLLYVTIGSPLSSISHLSFSLHMIQMSILYFIIPPIILLGIPSHVFNQVFKLPKIKWKIVQSKIPLYSFAVLFLIYHFPIVLNFLSQNANLQNGYLILLFILSFGMWWPIVSPDPKQRLSKGHMKRYVFLSGLVLMPACMLFILTAFIDGGNNPFLHQITAQLCISPESSSLSILPPPFNTTFDQVMAGILMLGLHKFGLIMTFIIDNKVRQSI
jgi:putative membrane protein